MYQHGAEFHLQDNNHEFEFQCCIGKNGFANKRIEGDKKTPKGTFSLEKLYYRSDKLLTHSLFNSEILQNNSYVGITF